MNLDLKNKYDMQYYKNNIECQKNLVEILKQHTKIIIKHNNNILMIYKLFEKHYTKYTFIFNNIATQQVYNFNNQLHSLNNPSYIFFPIISEHHKSDICYYHFGRKIDNNFILNSNNYSKHILKY